MIVTVTMNPAMDRTVEQTAAGNVVETWDVGGKGINVARTVKILGGDCVATGILAGKMGERIEKELRDMKINTDFIKVEGNTRVNTKMVDKNGILTEHNEKGSIVSRENVEKLEEKLLSYAGVNTFFVLSGSVPPGVEEDFYKNLIEKLHQRGAKVFLDASGELLRKGIQATPDGIKPNQEELRNLLRENDETELELVKKLLSKGIAKIILSRGSKGASFYAKEGCYNCPGITVESHSAVGAGDAMVAALVYGMEKGDSWQECIRLAMAASAGAVMTQGTKPPVADNIQRLKTQVRLSEVLLKVDTVS